MNSEKSVDNLKTVIWSDDQQQTHEDQLKFKSGFAGLSPGVTRSRPPRLRCLAGGLNRFHPSGPRRGAVRINRKPVPPRPTPIWNSSALLPPFAGKGCFLAENNFPFQSRKSRHKMLADEIDAAIVRLIICRLVKRFSGIWCTGASGNFREENKSTMRIQEQSLTPNRLSLKSATWSQIWPQTDVRERPEA